MLPRRTLAVLLLAAISLGACQSSDTPAPGGSTRSSTSTGASSTGPSGTTAAPSISSPAVFPAPKGAAVPLTQNAPLTLDPKGQTATPRLWWRPGTGWTQTITDHDGRDLWQQASTGCTLSTVVARIIPMVSDLSDTNTRIVAQAKGIAQSTAGVGQALVTDEPNAVVARLTGAPLEMAQMKVDASHGSTPWRTYVLSRILTTDKVYLTMTIGCPTSVFTKDPGLHARMTSAGIVGIAGHPVG